MQEGRDAPIAEALKANTSISEVAERFSVSRPTLYKYMDFYDSGETARIPSDIRAYFDMVSSKETTKDESKLYLMMKSDEIEKKNASERNKEEFLKTVEALYSAKKEARSGISWTDDEPGSLCVSEGGVTTVFFRGGFDGYDSASVVVSLETEDDSTDIGTYVPDRGMSFVTISNLPAGLQYTYRIEMSQGSVTMVSDSHRLRTRRLR